MDYSALARTYNPLINTLQLRELLSSFYQNEKYSIMDRYELLKVANSAIYNNYEGELIIKYKLAREFRNKKYIAAFEVKAKNSRTDFLVINGDTKSFEVKSKIDTLNRLGKQIVDYGDVFEFNTVVVDKVHLESVLEKLPSFYGIWYFNGRRKVVHREASYSPNINPMEQLGLMNKKELLKAFGDSNKSAIISQHRADQINQILKDVLKARYQSRWAFVQENWETILPIDTQFFFNTNVKPEIIYGL